MCERRIYQTYQYRSSRFPKGFRLQGTPFTASTLGVKHEESICHKLFSGTRLPDIFSIYTMVTSFRTHRWSDKAAGNENNEVNCHWTNYDVIYCRHCGSHTQRALCVLCYNLNDISNFLCVMQSRICRYTNKINQKAPSLIHKIVTTWVRPSRVLPRVTPPPVSSGSTWMTRMTLSIVGLRNPVNWLSLTTWLTSQWCMCA